MIFKHNSDINVFAISHSYRLLRESEEHFSSEHKDNYIIKEKGTPNTNASAWMFLVTSIFLEEPVISFIQFPNGCVCLSPGSRENLEWNSLLHEDVPITYDNYSGPSARNAVSQSWEQGYSRELYCPVNTSQKPTGNTKHIVNVHNSICMYTLLSWVLKIYRDGHC